MPAWLDAIMSPLKAAGEGLQKLIEVRDLAKFGDKFRKLLAEVLSAQQAALAAQTREAALLERISELEEEVTRFETWEREKQRYELKNLGFGSFAYMLKREERGITPPHWVCANCYEHGHIATLQYVFAPKTGQRWLCPSCKNTIDPDPNANAPSWMD